MIVKETILYKDRNDSLEAFVAYDGSVLGKLPAVILCHAWSGRDSFIEEKAELMASWGFVGFALDMYGKGIRGKSKEENASLKAPFVKDRLLLQRRLMAAFETLKSLPFVDENYIVVLGFGFGGLCALDFVRSGVPLEGVISVYGHYAAPEGLRNVKIQTKKILILHGYNDPIVKLDELHAFEKEMNEWKVDWQVHMYGNTMHAFTNPYAKDLKFGTLYNPVTAAYAWDAIHTFLNNCLKSKISKISF